MKNGGLVNAIAQNAQLSNEDCEKVIDAAIEAVINALLKEKTVQIHGFGAFSTRQRVDSNPDESRKAIDPVFTPGKSFRDAVKKNPTR
jgi:nucleoid DNA-binding protein